MYDLPPNTLYSFGQNPLHTQNRFGSLSAKHLTQEIATYKKNHKIACPESEAILFYLVNHALHVIKSNYNPLQELPPKVAEFAHKCDTISTRISKALFFHVCCVAHGMLWVSGSQLKPEQVNYFEQNFGAGFKDYLMNKSRNGGGVETAVKDASMTIHQFLGGLSSIYNFGAIIAWGKPYSMIIKTIHKASNGSYSLYTAADHVWSLCHNGGTILNKGIGNIFQVSSDFLFDILDVQDAGQIPNWVHKNQSNRYMNAEVKALYKEFHALFPKEFNAPDEKVIAVSRKKREAAHKAMHAQYRQWWGNPNALGAAAGGQNDKIAKPPEQKIDALLIDTFKKNKMF